MNAIRLRKTIDSDTLHLPELKRFVGRTVEIIILEEPPQVRPGTGDWHEVIRALDDLQGYDFDASREQRDFDTQHANDHLI